MQSILVSLHVFHFVNNGHWNAVFSILQTTMSAMITMEAASLFASTLQVVSAVAVKVASSC